MPFRVACRLLLLCAIATPLLAQSTPDALQGRLLNKALYLRGFWRNDKLNFDSACKHKGFSPTLPFTLSGVEITKVDLQPKKLALTARRVAIVFDQYTTRRVVLQFGPPDNKHDEQMNIEIDAPTSGDYHLRPRRHLYR